MTTIFYLLNIFRILQKKKHIYTFHEDSKSAKIKVFESHGLATQINAIFM